MRILVIICMLLGTQLFAQKPNKNCPDDLSLGCNPASIPGPDLKILPGGGRCKIVSKSLASEVKSNIGCDFTIVRTYTLVNSCGETLTCVQHIFWKEDKIPPVLHCPKDTNLGCNPGPKDVLTSPGHSVPAHLLPIAIDNCDGLIVAKFVKDSVTTNGCETIVFRIYEAKDACGNKSRCTQKITFISDKKPPKIISCPDTLFLGCNPDLSNGFPLPNGFPKFEDKCFVHINWFDGGDVTVTNCVATHTRLWIITDLCGNQATCEQKIIWTIDVTPPLFQSCGASINYGCVRVAPDLPVPDRSDLVVADGCGPIELFFFADTVITNECMYLVHYKFTARDKCGNKSECVREFRWKIITAPIQDIPFPADKDLICQSPVIETEEVPGTCGVGYPIFQHSDTIGNYPSDYTIIVEWKKFDCFGKFIVDTQYIHIVCEITNGIAASKHSFEQNATWTKMDQHYWRIRLKEPIDEGSVSLIDLLGRVRLMQKIAPGQLSADIDVSSFDVGVYILLLKDKTHSISHKIFIPQ